MNIGQGTAPQNQMNIGQGTVPQNQMNSKPMTGQGVNPVNPMMMGNGAVVSSTNGTLIGGIRPMPPNIGQGVMGSTTMDPLSMETTTREFINGYGKDLELIRLVTRVFVFSTNVQFRLHCRD